METYSCQCFLLSFNSYSLSPLVALGGLQHHARVLAVGRAVGAAGGLAASAAPLPPHPALALPLARVVPAGQPVHVVRVGAPAASGRASRPSAGGRAASGPAALLPGGDIVSGLAAASVASDALLLLGGVQPFRLGLLVVVFVVSPRHSTPSAAAGR